MLKKFNPKFNTGSLFICSKCGQGFDQPAPDQAEKLKTDLRAELKAIDAHTKVRVMVSGCLGICEKNEQTFAYYPNQGEIEVYTTSKDFSEAKTAILNFVKNKT